jgi:glycosyltransferase involved in cell wall biosynthesis
MSHVPRLAWFSPMPPTRTGVATCSADLVRALRGDHEIDVFVDGPATAHGLTSGDVPDVQSAHDFLWRHHVRPYDLTVYQLGNSSKHDFIWPYLFRFPGLAVLHDAHLHHARAASLLRSRRRDEYRKEFAAAEPDVPADLAELAVSGFDTYLYYSWPMTRLVATASKITAVHTPILAEWLREQSPAATVEPIRLGHGRRVTTEEAGRASARVRDRHGIPRDAVLFGVFGGLSPEKRIPQVLDAFAALLRHEPGARLLLAGAPAEHYDAAADIARLGLAPYVTRTGYLEEDRAFDEYVAACDVTINLRWPTAREVSGPWLRALAAGRPTVTTDLAHTAGVPALDPRTWQPHQAGAAHPRREPVAVSVDILDEDHSLRLALRRLARDPELRARLGRAAAAYWNDNHSVEHMVEDYRRVIAGAIVARVPAADLPVHLRADGSTRLAELLQPFGLPAEVWSKI